jgi:hypothetical protein
MALKRLLRPLRRRKRRFRYRGELSERFRATNLHRHASPTQTKDVSITRTIPGGKIRIYYTPVGADKETFVDIPATIVMRDCEAYGKDMWIQSGEGWIGK